MDLSTSTQLSATGQRTRRRLESVAGNWPIGVKIAAATVVVAAPVAQLIDRAMFEVGDGFVDIFRASTANPSSVYVGAVASMFAPALVIGAVFIWFQLARSRSPIAASISLITGILAFTCLALTTGYSYAALALAHANLGTPAAADALATYDGPPATLLMTTFTITSAVSILAAGWGLWRSHAVSRASVILLVAFIVCDVVEFLPFDVHVIGLAATVLMSISFFTAAPLRSGRGTTSINP